jgi:WD40 repeat protein
MLPSTPYEPRQAISPIEISASHIWGATFIPNSTSIAIISTAKGCEVQLNIWDIINKKCIDTIKYSSGIIKKFALNFSTPDAGINGTCVARDEVSVISPHRNGILYWDLSAHSATRIPPVGGYGSICEIALATRAGLAITNSTPSTHCCIWDLRNRIGLPPLTGHSSEVRSIAVDSNANHLLTATCDRNSRPQDTAIRLWDIKSKKCIAILDDKNPPDSIEISPDGRFGFSSGYSDCHICVWDLETKAIIKRLRAHEHSINEIAVSANGKVLMSLSTKDKAACIWDLQTFECIGVLKIFKPSYSNSIALSSDGRYALYCSGQESPVMIWDLTVFAQTGKFDSTKKIQASVKLPQNTEKLKIEEKLKTLKSLFEQGLITENEYATKRDQVLSQI